MSSAPLPIAAFDSDESALVEALRAGDAAAYETLVRRHGGRMLSVARRFLRHEEDARDAVQEAFLQAFRALPGFAGGAQLGTWLHRIVVNASLMKLRTRRRKPEQPIDELLPAFLEDGHHVQHVVDWRDGADKLLERAETRAFVRECIDQLPETYRTVLLLRDIEELDTEEAARVLEVSTNVVKVRLHRARQALRTLLDRRLGGGVL
jgi:RNA polymerase sigma-70 factor (ECF subfamily)